MFLARTGVRCSASQCPVRRYRVRRSSARNDGNFVSHRRPARAKRQFDPLQTSGRGSCDARKQPLVTPTPRLLVVLFRPGHAIFLRTILFGSRRSEAQLAPSCSRTMLYSEGARRHEMDFCGDGSVRLRLGDGPGFWRARNERPALHETGPVRLLRRRGTPSVAQSKASARRWWHKPPCGVAHSQPSPRRLNQAKHLCARDLPPGSRHHRIRRNLDEQSGCLIAGETEFRGLANLQIDGHERQKSLPLLTNTPSLSEVMSVPGPKRQNSAQKFCDANVSDKGAKRPAPRSRSRAFVLCSRRASSEDQATP